MSNFKYYISNLIVIKLLHLSALRPQAESNHKVVLVIEHGAIVSLICCHPKIYSVLSTECCHSLFSRKKYPLTLKLLY